MRRDLLMLMVGLLAFSLWAACRADADESDHMGSRWTTGVEQPADLAKGWRCDLWRGHRDWPSSVGCHLAEGDATYVDPTGGRTDFQLTGRIVWPPAGLHPDWTCAEWRLGDTALVSACYPLELP